MNYNFGSIRFREMHENKWKLFIKKYIQKRVEKQLKKENWSPNFLSTYDVNEVEPTNKVVSFLLNHPVLFLKHWS